jgi:AraC-like DNA-binding protein/tetratricopeptide (TPR) repeat protein
MDGSLSLDQVFIKKLTDIILSNLENDQFGVEELSRMMGMSHSTIHRKLRSYTHHSLSQFIREVRLQKAHEMLEQNRGTISEISYRVGFGSPTYFDKCFHEYFGYSPGKVKKADSRNPNESFGIQISSRPVPKKTIPETLSFYKFWVLVMIGLIATVSILFYPEIFKKTELDDLRSSDGRISVAVMPFQNMTDEKTWNGIQTNLISYLSNYEELTVRNKEAISSLLESNGIANYASITPSVAGRISQKLNANIFINGIIEKAVPVFRVNAQLANAKTKEVIRSFQIEGPAKEDEVLRLIDSLSLLIKNFLVISKMEEEVSPDLKPYIYNTNSPEAYQYFIDANDATKRYDITGALTLYSRAVAIDSNFLPAIVFLSMRYEELGLHEDAKKWCLKAYEKREEANKKERILVEWHHAALFETPVEEIKYLKQSQDADDQIPVSYWRTGNAYLKLSEYSKAIPEYEKALEIYDKWGIKPMMAGNYTALGLAYHKTGQYKKEKKLYSKAGIDFPDDPDLIASQALLSLAEGDTVCANRYIEKLRSALTYLSRSETQIAGNLAYVYSEAGYMNKAEEYYRQALSSEPENADRLNELAWFLIDKNRSIEEGLELVEKALEINPLNYLYLHTKGLGLYKLGKNKEALELLERSWGLKPVYDHGLFLHLTEVKKAVAGQKNI